MRYKDIEKRLAELERQADWRWRPEATGQIVYDDAYIAEVVTILVEVGVLPRVEDYEDEAAWLDAVCAKLEEMYAQTHP
jgi:hypothetical protein